ncbi:hypothetical protein PCC7424_5883 (plasmid) [Gloeothece citriformis PCC 7424]|uniref:Uncharacterized protein n=1 Tax=Gloeothece citriformis (strain PCC 7424) TaxID=65393 RepID=B7KMA8_GLOC7|nr:hypothetical protein [Gloeothece citriformis]ACK73930.1 hypothetical protein PCC7424_5883 [Gloeothece citriformis PCC 7424]
MFKEKRRQIEESIGVKKVREILPYKIPSMLFLLERPVSFYGVLCR